METRVPVKSNVSDAAKVRSQLRKPVAAPQAVSPWEQDAPADRSNKVYQAQALDTCPWGPPSDDAQSVRSGKSKAPSYNTCPWGDGGRGDRDSDALERAQRLKQRVPPSQEGCAGIGAPRAPASPINSHSQQAQQQYDPSTAQKPASSSLAPGPESNSSAFSPTYDSEAEAQERSALIEKCLMHGLSDDEIEGVLREHMFQKEAERQQREIEKSGTLKPSEIASLNTSVAAQRQAKAKGSGKGSPQYGPTDEEVADMLYNNRTPSPQAPAPSEAPNAGLRDRKKAEITGKVGDLAVSGSRNAFFECQQGANAAKDRNRVGQGIF